MKDNEFADKVEAVTEWLNREIARAKKEIDGLAAMLGDCEGYSYRLESTDNLFRFAARHDVFTKVLGAFKSKPLDEERWQFVRDFCLNEMHKKTLFPKRSTSMTSNLVEQERGSAWADIWEVMGGGR